MSPAALPPVPVSLTSPSHASMPPPDAPANERMPCGASRQWFAELAPDAIYFIYGASGSWALADLLPNPFQLRPDPSTRADQ